jgi:hypothetical protein
MTESGTGQGTGQSRAQSGKSPGQGQPGQATGQTASRGSARPGGAERKPASERFAAAMAVAKSAASSTPTVTAPRRTTGKVRKARLRVSHIDPWSVMKTSFLLSVALGIVTVVAVAVVWSLLGAAGIWDAINSAVGDVVSEDGESTFAIEDYLGTSRVLGFTMLVAVVDVVLVTVVATLGAFLYNLAAALLGGFEVTLSEDV